MCLLRATSVLLLATLAVYAAAAPIPVILDTDIGDDIDDALALALALQSPELNVLAVNTVLQHGDRRADLTWRILELYGRTSIPVGVGAEQPLLAPGDTSKVKQTEALAPGYRMPDGKRHNGIELLIHTCMNAREKVTILAYGPATNIALALRAEPRIAQHIERIVLMNGVFFRAGVEYNTRRDPEASEIVYSSGLPITTVGLDVTMQCRLTLAHLKQMEESKLENVLFLRKLIGYWQGSNTTQAPILHDPLAILVAFEPSLVNTLAGRVRVETKGQPQVSYGLTSFRQESAGNVQVASEVKAAAVVDMFITRVIAAPRK
jgi:purine nucleosidase